MNENEPIAFEGGFITVNDVISNDDGTATVIVDMDEQAIKVFARVGLQKTLMDSINAMMALDDIDNNVGCRDES
jgi:hypothetical protein